MSRDKTYEEYEADATEAMRGLHEAVESIPDPRCAVCGGPDAEGNGCEYCPDVAA